uniref:Fucosyltransferase n=1 Tax=Sinocyclocheilus anshuiensis TaxID=1608454 RepID=A0A671RA16_9TELE
PKQYLKRKTALNSCSSNFNIDGCYLTVDRELYSKAHGVLINHRDIKSDLSNLPTKPRPFFQKGIWMHFERDADIVLRELIMIKTEDTEDKIFPQVLDKKDKLVCWIVSNWNEKHERVKYYNELFNPLTLGSVPVALGAPRYIYERFLPKDAFIHVKDFSSPQKLAEHLLSLDKNVEEYKKNFQWRKHFEVKLVNHPQEHACCACQYTRTKKDYQVFGNLNKWYWDAIKDGT